MAGWIQLGALIVILVVAYRPLGDYMAWALDSPRTSSSSAANAASVTTTKITSATAASFDVSRCQRRTEAAARQWY